MSNNLDLRAETEHSAAIHPRRALLFQLLSPDLTTRAKADLSLASLGRFSQSVITSGSTQIDYFYRFNIELPPYTTLIEELTPGLLGIYDPQRQVLGLIDIFSRADGKAPITPADGTRVLERFGIATDQNTAAEFFTELRNFQDRVRLMMEAPLTEWGMFSFNPELIDLNIMFNLWQFMKDRPDQKLESLKKYFSADKVGLSGIYLFASPENAEPIINWVDNAPDTEVDWLRELFTVYGIAVDHLNEAKFLTAYYPQQAREIFPTTPVADFGVKALGQILEGMAHFTKQKAWQLETQDKTRMLKLISATSLLFYPSSERSKFLAGLRISPVAFNNTLAILSEKGEPEAMAVLGELTMAAWKIQAGALPESELAETVSFYEQFFASASAEALADQTTGDTLTEIERIRGAIQGIMENENLDQNQVLIMELGVGPGRILKQIRSAFPQAEVIGIDILSQEILVNAGLPKDLPFIQGDIVQIKELLDPKIVQNKRVIAIAPWSVVCDVYEVERFETLWASLRNLADFVIVDVPDNGYAGLLQQQAETSSLPPFITKVRFELGNQILEKPFLLLPPLALFDLLERHFGYRIENFPETLAVRKQILEKAESARELLIDAKDVWREPLWTTQQGKLRLTLIIKTK